MMSTNAPAIVFLTLIAAAPLVWLTVAMFRSPYTPIQTCLFLLDVLLTRVLWRAVVPERLPLDITQGAVLVCNHRSSIDPFFFQLPAGRPVHWMVAREYCQLPIIGHLLRICEIIPVGRGGVDTAATKEAIRIASGGGLIGMFPEGRINMTDEFLLPVRPGPVLIALKARVPILPCFVDGSPYDRQVWSPFLMPARVRVRVGQPIDLSPYYGREREDGIVQQLICQSMSQVAKLAGHDDYQPRLAGRQWKPTSKDISADVAARIKLRKQTAQYEGAND